MHIERIQVEEGFLDGFDVSLVQGLNVFIGARGTGKTSVIELVRFCLGVKGFTPDSEKRSRDHALSVLGSGQIAITLAEGSQRIVVTRTADDEEPRATARFSPPIVFSQTEIETVGLRPGGRLQLLDSFVGARFQLGETEAEAISAVRSLTAEVDALRREIDTFDSQLSSIPEVDQQIMALVPAEQGLAKTSIQAAEKKSSLDALSRTLSANAVAVAAIRRFDQATARWQQPMKESVTLSQIEEPWPVTAGEDPIKTPRAHLENSRKLLQKTLAELEIARSEISKVDRAYSEKRAVLEEQARQLRKDMEVLQAGAGAVVRQGQQLRERKAQLESLKEVVKERRGRLEKLVTQRQAALDRLDASRDRQFQARSIAAAQLNETLGPRIRISVSRAGQFEAFAAAITEVLRGSGLRYGDLAPVLAEQLSPRELLEAADSNDFEIIAEASGVSRERAARVLGQIKEADLGALATVAVEDRVEFQLLDGTVYKDISELSTGQRCTVILPLVLRHTERLLIVDQPEDHIDNAFIAETLIRAIVARDPGGQIVFSTHNANIPVLGNADRVVHLGSDGRRGFVLSAASLNDTAVVSAITTVMEGGADAFARRASFYDRNKKR